MSEKLGENVFHNQSYRLRVKILTGRLKIKPSDGQAPPVKPHPENHLAAKNAKEREPQRAAEATSGGKRQKQTHLHHHPHKVHGGTSCDNGVRDSPRLLLAKIWSVSGEPPRVATSAGGENTLSAPSTLLFLHCHLKLDPVPAPHRHS